MVAAGLVCLLDVDNTLLDNDRVTVDLRRFLEGEIGKERTARYWELFEQLRHELGYADYLGALQRYRDEYPRDPHVLHLSPYLIDYPFANRLYPESLDVIEIIFALEKKYDVAIPFNANESAALAFETIGQVAEAVSKLVAKPA